MRMRQVYSLNGLLSTCWVLCLGIGLLVVGAVPAGAIPSTTQSATYNDQALIQRVAAQTAWTKEEAQKNFIYWVRLIIASQRSYPAEAREQKLEGRGILRLQIASTGDILWAELAESTGHASLDQEILALPWRIKRLPAFPPEMGRDEVWIRFPVSFQAP